MKILHIITHYYPHIYGAENFAKHLAEYQTNKHQVYLITGRWQKDWPKFEVINKVKVYRVPVIKIRYIQTILAIFPFLIKAIQLQTKYKFDIIHTHIFPSLVVGGLLKKMFIFNESKFITTIQGGDIGDYPESFGVPPIANIFKMFITWSLHQVDKIHCVSSYLQGEVSKMGVPQDKITVIPNGVDTDRFRLQASLTHSKSNHIKFISTSRLEDKNNLMRLLDILAQLKQRGYPIILDIYGTGSLQTKLNNKIKALNLTKIVKLKGYIDNSKLSNILPNYQFFIRLSKREGFGISFIEAMSCGVIPIGTVVGGITDIIDDNVNGVLVNSNIDMQIKRLVNLLDKPQDWQLLSKKARQTVKIKFSWEKVLTEMNKFVNANY